MKTAQETTVYGPGRFETNRRGRGRIRCEMLKSSHGAVVDLSAFGAQIEHIGNPSPSVGSVLTLKLKCKVGVLLVEARVRWVQKLRFRRQAVGLAFENLSTEGAKKLAEIARFSGCPWGHSRP